jgi:hypothetical protein
VAYPSLKKTIKGTRSGLILLNISQGSFYAIFQRPVAPREIGSPEKFVETILPEGGIDVEAKGAHASSVPAWSAR